MGQVTLTLPTLAFASRTVSILETYATSFPSLSQSRIDIRFRIQFRSLLLRARGTQIVYCYKRVFVKMKLYYRFNFFFFFFHLNKIREIVERFPSTSSTEIAILQSLDARIRL